MEDKNIVEWNDRLAIGIPLIDGQHKNLVDMTNKLYMGCLKGDEAARIYFMNTIHEAVDYTKYHFSTEERLMERIRYPEFSSHKKQHEDFIREIFREVSSFTGGRKFVPNLFVRYLRDWVLTHIAVSDRLIAGYLQGIKKQGLLKLAMAVEPAKRTVSPP
jgi:hemerythrin